MPLGFKYGCTFRRRFFPQGNWMLMIFFLVGGNFSQWQSHLDQRKQTLGVGHRCFLQVHVSQTHFLWKLSKLVEFFIKKEQYSQKNVFFQQNIKFPLYSFSNIKIKLFLPISVQNYLHPAQSKYIQIYSNMDITTKRQQSSMKKYSSWGVLWQSDKLNMGGSVRQQNMNQLHQLQSKKPSNVTNENGSKENMQHSTKPKTQDYKELKDKIHNLEERLGNIRKNYDILQKNKHKKSIRSAKLISPPMFKPDLELSPKNSPQEKVTSTKMIPQSPHSKPLKQSAKFLFKMGREQKTPKGDSLRLKKAFGPGKHAFDPKLGFHSQKPQKSKRYSLKTDENNVDMNDYITKYSTKEVMHSSSDSSLNNIRIQTKQEKYANKYYLSMVISAFKAAYPSSFQQMCRDHLTASLDLLAFMYKMNKKAEAYVPIPQQLPPPTRQTLIFDLDQTLIHCNEQISTPHDALLPILFPDKKIVTVGINIRPHIYECLKELRKYFELMVFTASHACYANVVINHIDPEGYFFSHRFFREHCYKTEEGMYVKDLRMIDRDLSRMLLIDNAAYSYAFQPENGVPILPFYDNRADNELKSLTGYLKQMFGVPDVRKKNDTTLKLSQYWRYSNTTELLNSLYP